MSSGLFLPEKPHEQNEDFMKIETLKKRLNKNRQMTEITLNIPSDVVDDLKRVAIKLGFTDYQPLIKAYIGQCLRKDLELLEEETITAFIASLERHGVNNDTIQEALLEIVHH
jgi:hypothetical protein